MNKPLALALILMAILWGLAAHWQALESDKAMSACQVTHSYEACFHTLER